MLTSNAGAAETREAQRYLASLLQLPIGGLYHLLTMIGSDASRYGFCRPGLLSTAGGGDALTAR